MLFASSSAYPGDGRDDAGEAREAYARACAREQARRAPEAGALFVRAFRLDPSLDESEAEGDGGALARHLAARAATLYETRKPHRLVVVIRCFLS